MPSPTPTITRQVLLSEEQWAHHLAAQTLQGLRGDPPSTPPVWFYDEVGSDLFDRITALAEYYPTRAERAILRAHADDIASLSAASSLVELGAGSADKTRVLLEALRQHGSVRRFVPIDCSASALDIAARNVTDEFPDIAVHAVVADFNAHLPHLPREPGRLVAFLGSTVGNFTADQRARFLADVAGDLRPGDSLLLGTDLVKAAGRLVAAYDDTAGVTAAFNLNALVVMNRRLGADFDPGSYRHHAVWDAGEQRIEMRLVAQSDQRVTFTSLGDHVLTLDAGQWLRTEISVKFTPDQVRRELQDAGLRTVGQWTDPASDFLLTLAQPPAQVRDRMTAPA